MLQCLALTVIALKASLLDRSYFIFSSTSRVCAALDHHLRTRYKMKRLGNDIDCLLSEVQIMTHASEYFHIGIDLSIASICSLMIDVAGKVEYLPFAATAAKMGAGMLK